MGAEIKFQYRLEKRDIDSELDRYFQNIDHQLDLDAELKPAAEYAIVYEKTVS